MLLEACLDYDPNGRIYFKSINNIMEKITSISAGEVRALIEEGKKIKLIQRKNYMKSSIN